MSRLVPYPLLTAGLILMWLVLNRFSAGHLLLGTAVAIVAGKSMSALQPAKPRIRRWDLIPRLFGVVVLDILRSNLAVATLILTGGRHGQRRSGFVEIPLALRDPTGARHPRGHRHRHAGHRLDAVRRPARRGAAACLRPRRGGGLDRA